MQERPAKRLINYESKSDKSYAVHSTVMIHDFWDTLAHLSHIISLFSKILAALESDHTPLSIFPLSFSFMLDAIVYLPESEKSALRTFILARWKLFYSDGHILAVSYTHLTLPTILLV